MAFVDLRISVVSDTRSPNFREMYYFPGIIHTKSRMTPLVRRGVYGDSLAIGICTIGEKIGRREN